MGFETPLIPVTLIRRYKRFLTDCPLPSGQEITAHCADPWAMMELAQWACESAGTQRRP